MSASYFNLLKYAATGQTSPDMTYYDKLRASTLMGGAVQTLTGQPPLTFKADGSPLISWSMKGAGQQTGTPTPDNPVMPEFVGARTVNLFDKDNVEKILVGTTGTETANNNYVLSTFISVDNGVTVSATKLFTDPIRIIRYDANKQFISRTDENTANNIVIDDCAYIRINANKDHWDISTIQAEYGRTATPYEPFGWAIPISCGGSTTPVYLGQTQTVRRVKKLVLTGEEDITKISGTAPFRVPIPDMIILGTADVWFVCSHYIAVPNIASWSAYYYCISWSSADSTARVAN